MGLLYRIVTVMCGLLHKMLSNVSVIQDGLCDVSVMQYGHYDVWAVIN